MAQAKIKTPEFRVAFAHVFQPRKSDSGKDQYELQMVFPKGTDISAIKKLAEDAVRERWPNGIPKNKPFKSPFRDGAEKAHLDGFGPDVVFIRASTQQRPPIFGADNVEIINPEDFYSGCYAEAIVNAYVYERPEKNGVSIGLLGLRKRRDGQPFVTKATADDFGAPLPEDAGKTAAPAAAGGDSLFD